MYRRPKFLEVLLEIRRKMSREADYDVDLFAEMIRSGGFSKDDNDFVLSDNQTAENKPEAENRKPQSWHLWKLLLMPSASN